MKSSPRKPILWSAWMLTGLLLIGFGLGSLRSSGNLQTDRNPLAVEGSAYGRLLARLSETTVDRVWHLGVEQIVPHNIDGSLAAGQHHAHDHGEHNHSEKEVAKAQEEPDEPVLDQLKDWFSDMRVVKYTRTNPYSLNERHLATVQQDIEEMLLRSYRMDPGHYGVYNSYHLFLTTHDFGGTPEKREHAKAVANATIAEVFKEDEDPEPWLTAAAAAMNLYLLETETNMISGTPVPLETLKEYRSKIGFCLGRFDELQAKAEENGNWQNLSYERQYEIVQRQRFASRTFKQFDAMIARAESSASGEVEAKVAKKESDDD